MKTFHASLLLTLPLLALPVAAQDVRVGLVSYWPMDEVSVDGLTTPDNAQLHTNLTLLNMTAANLVAGHRGNAMSFNGTNQLLWADTGTGANPGLPLQKGTRKTICLWIKGDGPAQQDRRFFAEASMATNAPMFNMGTDSAATGRTGKVDIYIRDDANAATVNHAKSVGTPLDNTWHHIALTDDNGVVRYYFDGVLDTATLSYTRPTMTVNTISFGGIMRQSGAAGLFSGAIDDAAVWNRILSPSEIQQVMASGISTPIPPLVSASRQGPYRQGDRVRFSLDIKGFEPTTWQWRLNGTDIPGATESTYTTPPLTAAQQGDYTALVNGTEVSSTAAVVVTSDPAPTVTTNLVSWWPFNEVDVTGFPTTTPDPWGGHPLSCTDIDGTALVPGQFGTAMEFDGVSRIAYRTTGFPITSNPEYTVSLWVKGDGTTQSDLRVFAEGSNASNAQLFALGTAQNNTDKMRVYVRNDANVVAVEGISTAAVFDNNWHHIAWTDRNGVARLYVDGLLDLTTFTYNRAASVFTLNQTSVGAVQRAVPTHWSHSTIDDVAVWNRALTYTEIEAIRATGVPAPVSAVAPEITVNPLPRTLWAGRAVTLSIQATGTAPFTYQWYHDNAPIPTGTDANLILDPAQATDSGVYYCKVTNTAGSDDSGTATVLVKAINNIDTGRISAWPMESGETTTADTLSGHDLNLTAFTAAPWFPAVKDNGVGFDGVDDQLSRTRSNTGTDIPLSTREEFSIAFWVRGIGPGQADRRVISEGSTSNTNPLFNIGTDTAGVHDKLDIYIRSDTGAAPVNHRVSTAPVYDGFWHHVIYTDYRGSVGVYVDGVQDSNFVYTRPAMTPNTFSIGGILRATPTHWFKGGVDEVNTWERAISPEEAAAYFASQPKPAQVLEITGMTVPFDGQIQFTLSTSHGNADYRLESSDSLLATTWTQETNASIGAVTAGVVTIDLPATMTGRRFYRVYIPNP